MKKEPAVILSAILAVVVALLSVLTEFGVDLTSGQQVAIVGFVGAVGSLVVGLVTRSLVVPVAKLDSEVDPEGYQPRRAAL